MQYKFVCNIACSTISTFLSSFKHFTSSKFYCTYNRVALSLIPPCETGTLDSSKAAAASVCVSLVPCYMPP